MSLSVATALLLLGCGGRDEAGTANLNGQVGGVVASTPVNHYAASRFLEQSSMGPSPASVAQVRAQGPRGLDCIANALAT